MGGYKDLKITVNNIQHMDKELLFPNGLYIFNKEGNQIDPSSIEGEKIKSVFTIQEDIKKSNREQTLKWILDTFPNDKENQEKYKKKFGV